ncbi:SRPBCC domain-containing protein [Paraburkholderia sp.]|uniref:SRPBCC domain-containing protein n=1 Tax=Paraburkholderia sp. TaxID=1926495 RepID=UPI002F3F5835
MVSILRLAKRLIPVFAALAFVGVCVMLALHHDESIHTEVWINSPPQAVWTILTDTADYPRWNPEISRLDGALREGSVIEFVAGSGEDAMVFHPRLLAVRPLQELRWKGSVWLPGIFDGEHRFVLEPAGNRTHFIQSEQFTGILAGKLTEDVVASTAESMKAMNAALKARAEQANAH